MICVHPLLDTVDDNTILWRYMSLSKFLYLIKNAALFFCRLDNFNDKHEGCFTLLDEMLFQGLITQEDLNKERQRNFACCWIDCPHELNLMWKSYGAEGVAIKTTVCHIKESMANDKDHKVSISKVRYIDAKDGRSHFAGESICVYHFLYAKRLFFMQEKEVRLLYSNNDIRIENQPEKGIDMPVDLSKLIDEVVISPFADSYLKKMVEKELLDCGLKINVSLSEI